MLATKKWVIVFYTGWQYKCRMAVQVFKYIYFCARRRDCEQCNETDLKYVSIRKYPGGRDARPKLMEGQTDVKVEILM